jgi:capsule polysaccharide export protein KpsE/RkpR
MPASIDLAFLRSRAVLKRIAIVALACCALGGLYALIAPPWYRAILTVVPSKASRGGLPSILGAELSGLAAGLEGTLGGSADAARIAAVMQSIAVTDAVIDRFDLQARYKKKYREDVRDALWDHCDVKTLLKPNLVQLSCEDKDPRFVQEMLGYFAEIGNQVFRRVSVTSASEEVRFLEKHVADLRQQADESGVRLREFQEKYQIIDLETQAKAVVSSLAALNNQRITKELELDYARTFSSSDEASLRQLESQLSVMSEKQRDLEEPPSADGSAPQAQKKGRRSKDGTGMFPAALAVPKLRADYEKLYRDRRVSEATLVFALEQLEGAKSNEARSVSTFQVLDPPVVPTKRDRPQRLVVLLLSLLLGIMGGATYEWWKSGGSSSFGATARPTLRSGNMPDRGSRAG